MNLKLLALAVLTVSLLAGCANTKIADNEMLDKQAKDLASKASLTPVQAIAAATQRINEGKGADLEFYAPLHMKAAQEALDKARTTHGAKGPASQVLEEAFRVESLMTSAYKHKEVTQRALSKSLAHKGVLEELKVPELRPREYQKAVEHLQNLIRDIEGGFVDKALKAEPEVLAEMTALEVATLKQIHLVPVQSMLTKAEDVDADKYAEKTLSQADQALLAANLFIEKNYRDRAGVKKIAITALNAATRAYQIALESKAMEGLNAEQSEARALYISSLFDRINQQVGVSNLHNLSFRDQAAAIAEKGTPAATCGVQTAPALSIEPMEPIQPGEDEADEVLP